MTGLPSSAWTTSTSALASGRISFSISALRYASWTRCSTASSSTRARTEHALEDGSRRLAGSESGNARASRQVPDGFVDGLAESFGGKLDLELDDALRRRGGGDVHRPGSIGPGGSRAGGVRAGVARPPTAAPAPGRIMARWRARSRARWRRSRARWCHCQPGRSRRVTSARTRKWWNDRHASFRRSCRQRREGLNPSFRTTIRPSDVGWHGRRPGRSRRDVADAPAASAVRCRARYRCQCYSAGFDDHRPSLRRAATSRMSSRPHEHGLATTLLGRLRSSKGPR